ncbi:Cytochrome P450 93A1 [Apostasia shenzhenica]|uniref:Cytochrome P450 93A1 n=1 Tax=Apostasia shenzhenica TaxID=1088818 RepID=A0A2I0B3R3_9ASPA|nr:Cytochrome P450 93A1 [Apostasia shenzhenica]
MDYLNNPYVSLILSLLALLPFIHLLRHRRHRLPPSPTGLPIVGHLHLLSGIPHRSLHQLSLRLGPLFSLRLGAIPCVVASSAATAAKFFKTHDTSFSNRPNTIAVSVLTYGSSNFSFAPYGAFWRFTKRLYMTELFSSRTLSQFRPLRRDELRQLLSELHAKGKQGVAVDVGAELTRLTNNVTTRMAVSRRCSGTDGEADEMRRLVLETTGLLGKFNVGDYVWFLRGLDLQGLGRRLKDLHRRFDGMLEKIMKEKEEERRQRKEEVVKAKDLLDILMDIYEDEHAEDIFTGGTDNTSLTVQWALAELINHPPAMEKAKAELDAVTGGRRLVDEPDIPHLPYLQAVITETLRLHPPTPLIPRESSDDCTVDGFDIPARTRLFINAWAIGRDPEVWHRPLDFSPERFLPDGDGASGAKGNQFQMIPFGGGKRGCPGMTAAMQIVQSTLAALIQCFEWEIAGGGGPADMGEEPGLTLQRATPLMCVPAARMDLAALSPGIFV